MSDPINLDELKRYIVIGTKADGTPIDAMSQRLPLQEAYMLLTGALFNVQLQMYMQAIKQVAPQPQSGIITPFGGNNAQ